MAARTVSFAGNYPSGAWPWHPSLIYLFSLLLATLTGCAWRITPPTTPTHPVMVIVADYGHHSSLLLPGQDDGMVEFAWGDYEWFAKNHTGIWRALCAIFWSEGSTLGIKKYPPAAIEDPEDGPTMSRLTGANRLYRFAVSQDKVLPLRTRLLAAIDKGRDKTIHNDWNQMDFVPDDRHYWFADNCNHRTAQWLRELGCEVDGFVLFSNFEMKD
jgi:hypothetical protein